MMTFIRKSENAVQMSFCVFSFVIIKVEMAMYKFFQCHYYMQVVKIR
jgi:hypothetical protein